MTILLDEMKREINSYRVKAMNSIVFLTYRCTSRCKACNIWKRNVAKDSELDWEGWKKVFQRLKDYGVGTVEIFGGDALLRKDVIFKAIRFCNENGIETFLPTNSILLDKETARNLVDSGLGTIYFSLDEIDSASDMIRGVKGTFDKVKKALESLIEAKKDSRNPKIIICSTVSNMNYNHFMKLVEFLRPYPIDGIYPRVVVEFSEQSVSASEVNGILPEPFFVTSEGKSHLMDENQTNHFRKTIINLKSNNNGDRPYINFQGVDMAPDSAFISGYYGIRRCQVCTTVLTLNPNGDITPCLFYNTYSIGNIYKESKLDRIWGNERHREFIRKQRQGEIKICANCNMPSTYSTFPEKINFYLKRLRDKSFTQFR
jgi:radical SAM protein with 4Fe4S-binding SPASM domain